MTSAPAVRGVARAGHREGATGVIEALEFRHDVGRYLLSGALYRTSRRLWTARAAPLRRTLIPHPRAEQPGWKTLRVRLSGICGSDLALVTASDSLYLEPEATYPFVPGHEIVGESEGRRVAVWPVIGCRARGLAPCPSCTAGWEGLCTRRDDAWPRTGITIGFNRDTGGGWSDACLAHESQLWELPAGVSDADALLLDPASASLAALLRTQRPDVERTLVIGGGTIGQLAVRLHRALGLPGGCELLARHPSQIAAAQTAGCTASAVAGDDAFEEWAAQRGIGSRRVFAYGRVHRGVFDRVIDCAGTRDSLSWAIAAVRPRGQVVLVTAPASVRRWDPTPLWYRELTVHGINQYGPVSWDGSAVHPYQVLMPLLSSGALPVRDLVTHVFSFADWTRAFAACVRRSASGAIKVAFQPDGVRSGTDRRPGRAGVT